MGAKTSLRQVIKTPGICEINHKDKLNNYRRVVKNVSVPCYNSHIPTNERQKMKVEHNLKFVTEFADNHPVTAQMKMLDENTRRVMLESMLKELVGSRLKPILDEINAGGSYAILKVAE